MASDVVRVLSSRTDTGEALAEVLAELRGAEPVLMVFFCSAQHDGMRIQTELKKASPAAQVVGCTTAGEFTDQRLGDGGLVVLALSRAKVRRCATALAEYVQGESVEEAVIGAMGRLSRDIGKDVRELDPERWVGLVLDEGLHKLGDEVAGALGHAAPLLAFVGGSAGDNFKGIETAIYREGTKSTKGSVFVLMELEVPYTIVKTSSFEATETRVRMTGVKGHVVYEIDGRPAIDRYAELVGVPRAELQDRLFTANPLGVVIDGEIWARSPIKTLPDGGIHFASRIPEGAELRLLRSTDLIADTRRALVESARRLGGRPSIGIVFNCAQRAVEIDMLGLHAEFLGVLSAFPVVGFHCYGENYLVQLNQTMVGLVLG